MCARSTFHHPNSGCRARRSLRDQARVTKHVNLVAPVGLIPCWAKRFSVERVAVCLQPISRPRSGRTRTPRYGLHNLPSRTSDLNWIIISRLPWVAPGVTGEFFPLGHGHGGGWARHLQGESFVAHDLPFLEKKEKNMNRCLWPGCNKRLKLFTPAETGSKTGAEASSRGSTLHRLANKEFAPSCRNPH